MHYHIQSIPFALGTEQYSPIEAYYQLSNTPSLKINDYLRKCSLRFEVKNLILYTNAHQSGESSHFISTT